MSDLARGLQNMNRDTGYMRAALDAAGQALARGDMPIGAVVVIDDEIVAIGSNRVDSGRDDTQHAEMVAIRSCATALFEAKCGGSAELFTTMEPCAMCFGAIAHFRIARVVSGLDGSIAGVVDRLGSSGYYGSRGTRWERGFMADEACKLLATYQQQTGLRRHLKPVRHAHGYTLGTEHP